MDIPAAPNFHIGSFVVVTTTCDNHADFPEVARVTGIEWLPTCAWLVPQDQLNITIRPANDLKDGGADGFTPENLRLATADEIATGRRNP